MSLQVGVGYDVGIRNWEQDSRRFYVFTCLYPSLESPIVATGILAKADKVRPAVTFPE